jgi:hypothetical protein
VLSAGPSSFRLCPALVAGPGVVKVAGLVYLETNIPPL